MAIKVEHLMATSDPTPPLGYATVVSEVAYTTYLFIKSDIRTTLAPIAIFGLANSPEPSLSRVFPVVFWIFLHLIQFNISNQYLPAFIIEDSNNKPDRPIPSGRITLHRATQLRWALVPLCLALSSMYGSTVAVCSTIFLCMTAAYNELDGSVFWLTRDMINGTGFAALEAAATLVANPQHKLSPTTISAVIISALTFATTNFAQDFKDVVGDKLSNRRTIPVAFPNSVARLMIMSLLVGWSLILSKFWELSPAIAAAYIALAVFVGIRFNVLTELETDRTTYYYFYNLWISTSFALPAYYRLVSSKQSLTI